VQELDGRRRRIRLFHPHDAGMTKPRRYQTGSEQREN